MEQQNNNYGRDLNVTNISHADHVVIENSSPELPPLESSYRLTHYVLTFFSLSGNLITWIFLGFFAKSEFPIDYIWKLLMACLRGPEYFSKVLNKEQLKLYNLQEVILRAKEKLKQENLRLNDLNKRESKIEVLEKSIRRLYKEIEDKDASISRILNRLEYQKNLVQIDLEPLKQRLDPRLYKLEKLLQVLLDHKSSIEKDFEHMEAILKYLSDRYNIHSQNATAHLAENLLKELNSSIIANSDSMGHSRLAALKRVLYILQWVFSASVNSYSTDPSLIGSDNSNEKLDNFLLNNAFSDINLIFPDSTSTASSEPHEEKSEVALEQLFESLLSDVNTSEIELLDNRKESEQTALDRKTWIGLLSNQVELLLNQTTETSSDWINCVNEGIRREWIKKVSVYGLDNQGCARVELAIAVDWKKQEASFWNIDNTQPIELNKAIEEFNEFVSINELTSEWMVTSTDAKSFSLLDQLGFSSCNSPQWTTEGRSSKGPISEILRFLGIEIFPKLSVELNFGAPKSRLPLSSVNSYNSSSGCIFVFLGVAALFISIGLSSVDQKTNLTPQEQVYWNTLHEAIVVWDLETAQRNLIPLSDSKDSCVAEFASTLKAKLNTKGAQGFQDVNPVKNYLNEQHNCNLDITPHKLSP